MSWNIADPTPRSINILKFIPVELDIPKPPDFKHPTVVL